MNFKEAFDELKSKYEDPALTYTATVYAGKDNITIYAMGNGKCASASTYRGAIDALALVVAGTAEEPPEETF